MPDLRRAAPLLFETSCYGQAIAPFSWCHCCDRITSSARSSCAERQPGLFPQSTIELLQTFAAQSVLAIQNARLFSEIEEKSRALQVASQHKSQFLANMSHELRTPLNAIIGLTEMLREEAEGPEFAGFTEPLERVHRAGKHLLGLINDVLDLSKIEAGKIELHLEDFDLAVLVARPRRHGAAAGGQKRQSARPRVPLADIGTMRGDAMRVRQVLLNLLSNACKFTENGTVTLERRAIEPGRALLDSRSRRRHRHRHDARAAR